MFIDSHTHIFSSEFSGEYNDIISRATENNVERFILPNIDSSSIKPMLTLVDQFPEKCFPLIGLHPTSVTEDYNKELEIIEFWLKKRHFYGIGEIGLDFYWEKKFKDQQIEAFEYQIDWAKEYNLPLVLHVRESFRETISVLKNKWSSDLRGVFHSFTGTVEEALEIIDLGFYIGINGIVTFKNSDLSNVVKHIPLNKLLLETDSPYLAPSPYRGKRNESSYLPYIADKIASVHSVSSSEVAKMTTDNTKKLFNIV